MALIKVVYGVSGDPPEHIEMTPEEEAEFLAGLEHQEPVESRDLAAELDAANARYDKLLAALGKKPGLEDIGAAVAAEAIEVTP